MYMYINLVTSTFNPISHSPRIHAHVCLHDNVCVCVCVLRSETEPSPQDYKARR